MRWSPRSSLVVVSVLFPFCDDFRNVHAFRLIAVWYYFSYCHRPCIHRSRPCHRHGVHFLLVFCRLFSVTCTCNRLIKMAYFPLEVWNKTFECNDIYTCTMCVRVLCVTFIKWYALMGKYYATDNGDNSKRRSWKPEADVNIWGSNHYEGRRQGRVVQTAPSVHC